ncbi:hypothetical protein N8I77_007093 [Diaporthe amygdali]|uniref:Uncharacterized protein n=1 Tax=Phomopsis amygdali TaxID=1214568 RepID=A0AAD9SCG3_PHOAM|nr:hypothetical protein N8I77_007093 [Diaporthe amygdali]
MAKINLSGPITSAVLAGQPDSASLKDTTILVTGGAQGLGAEITTQCAAAGAYVTIADIDDTKGRVLASSLGRNVQYIHCDVTKWSDQVSVIKAAIRFAPSSETPATTLDHLVINAGVMDKPFFIGNETGMTNLDDDPSEPDPTPIEVNTKGAMFSLKLAQLYMSSTASSTTHKASPASVVFVLSPESYVTLPASIIYGGAKFGARGLFRSSRVPFANKGVRVNALVPWLMETGMNAGADGLSETLQSLGVHFVSVEAHARVVMHLLCDDGVAGRAVAVGQSEGGVFVDVEDDDSGGDGIRKYWELLYGGWLGAREGRQKMYGLMGFQDEERVWF